MILRIVKIKECGEIGNLYGLVNMETMELLITHFSSNDYFAKKDLCNDAEILFKKINYTINNINEKITER